VKLVICAPVALPGPVLPTVKPHTRALAGPVFDVVVKVRFVANVAKLAVTETGPFIVTLCGVAVPLNAPLNPVNENPGLAVALTGTMDPAAKNPVAGAIDPSANDGDTAVVNRYCVWKSAV
jgi:hypothetical protein